MTHVQATLDVSIQHGQKNGKGNENEATVVNGNEASDSMLQWQSQYATALQKGLLVECVHAWQHVYWLYHCPPAQSELIVHDLYCRTDPGTTSPPPNIVLTKGSEDMDKLFWMTRANQVRYCQQCMFVHIHVMICPSRAPPSSHFSFNSQQNSGQRRFACCQVNWKAIKQHK